MRLTIIILLLTCSYTFGQNKILRDWGIEIGILKTGKNNAITDIEGVRVGHTTKIAFGVIFSTIRVDPFR